MNWQKDSHAAKDRAIGIGIGIDGLYVIGS